ncbi:hypothetical protein Ahy_B09g095410 isoform B [Arachis hypogaea]|uniref:Uncharacterized protein n=1 Tax=Arachis hypogaea TaxID=3818 RepID=A0A444XDR3_ARAHY|nr:hypothetical protein Ahy_B09g095410 isoform B [Arachis hypogaea]
MVELLVEKYRALNILWSTLLVACGGVLGYVELGEGTTCFNGYGRSNSVCGREALFVGALCHCQHSAQTSCLELGDCEEG